MTGGGGRGAEVGAPEGAARTGVSVTVPAEDEAAGGVSVRVAGLLQESVTTRKMRMNPNRFTSKGIT
ncbi:MAG TPA: hypothetical protein VLE49_19630, partial [Anaerolineales bacterium]|nr:hypothetical protein [Anaerolineales bacterium]